MTAWKIPTLDLSVGCMSFVFVLTCSEYLSAGKSYASLHVRWCHVTSHSQSQACDGLWNHLALSNEQWVIHLRLYMVMMCRQLRSCRLYSWILFTWTSNMDDGFIFTLYSFSRYWANFTLLSCETNQNCVTWQQRSYWLRKSCWITGAACQDMFWF